MKKNGFTLIELLAVIVILAIIALIATPIILGIINDAREKSNERSVELYASAVKNGIAAHQLRTGNEVLPGTYTKDNKLPFEVEYDGKVECTNIIISEDGKVSLDKCTVNGGTKTYNYGIEGDETPSTPVAKICSITKQNSNKYSVGDVVTCNIGETPDKFYVIEDAELTATTIKMLTEKRIHTTEFRQSDDAEGVAFSSINYWVDENEQLLSKYGTTYPADVYDNNSLLYPIVEGYVNYLNIKLTGTTGSLLTLSQALNLGCTMDDFCIWPSNLSWAYSTRYWLATANDSIMLWNSNIDGSIWSGNSNAYEAPNGVRPVITISTTEIQ